MNYLNTEQILILLFLVSVTLLCFIGFTIIGFRINDAERAKRHHGLGGGGLKLTRVKKSNHSGYGRSGYQSTYN